jgi:type IV secretory pathway VirD2 relaxase
MDSEFDIEMHPGSDRRGLIRAGGKSLIGQVVMASKRNARTSLARRSGKAKGTGRHGRGRDAALRFRGTGKARRVVIKARIVRHTGKAFASGPMSRHIAYLQREGVTRDQQRGDLFDADRDRADADEFASRCHDDRHHFRFIISPEDATELADLRVFTRELILDMSRDLGTGLDWIGADHWNTDNPHVHVLVRGKTDHGTDLIVDREYMRHGLRFRAEQRATLELGMRTERDIQAARHREIAAERWTSLDASLAQLQDRDGLIDLRFDPDGDRRYQTQLAGRIETLTKMGLATAQAPGLWTLSSNAEEVLRQIELRSDIIKSMHAGLDHRLKAMDQQRGPADTPPGRRQDLAPQASQDSGRERPLRPRTGRANRADQALSGAQRTDESGPTQENQLSAAEADPMSLGQQISANGPTWLDDQLIHGRADNPEAGLSLEIRQALQERIAHLVRLGLASQQGGQVRLPSDLLDRLHQHELEKVQESISEATGKPMLPSQFGEPVEGTYRGQFRLCAGRYALIDNGFAFQLVPWQHDLERYLGETVSGLVNEHGRVDWSFTRERSIGL